MSTNDNAQPATRTFTATCHCQFSRVSFTVSDSQLPIPVHFCHCSICRHTHGNLLTNYAQISAMNPQVDLASFTAYKSSESTTRMFCSTCGAHMIDRVVTMQDGKEMYDWFVAVSLVDGGEEVWKFGPHDFVASTGDGGLAKLMGKIDGKTVKMWKTECKDDSAFAERGDWVLPEQFAGQRAAKGKEEKVQVQCHCGGVSFSAKPPSSPEIFNGWDNTLVPKDTSKWFGTHDVCTSCRLVTSTAIVSWVFVHITALGLPDGSAYPSDGVFGTAKTYKTSEDVYRTFCGTCGATVMYGCKDRPEIVDLAVGLLRAEGARAEDFVEWRTWKVSYEEDAVFKGVVKSLRDGLEESTIAEGKSTP